ASRGRRPACGVRVDEYDARVPRRSDAGITDPDRLWTAAVVAGARCRSRPRRPAAPGRATGVLAPARALVLPSLPAVRGRVVPVSLVPVPAVKLCLDAANLAEIAEINAGGVLDGVTTNPSLAAE